MFRIERDLVNLSIPGEEGNAAADAAGLTGPAAQAAAEQMAQEIIECAQAEAEEILLNAKNEAALVIRAAQDELEEHRSRAWQTGYNEGAEEGKHAYDDKLREDDEMLKSVLSELYDERASTFSGLEERVAALALDIAGKIITIAGENDDNVFVSLIENALRQMNFEGRITIRVSAGAYERFFSSGSAVFNLGGGVTVTASIARDLSLGEGDCVIDTDNETVNAGLSSQLRQIALAFEKVTD